MHKNKAKIGFLYYGEPADTNYWSGTISQLYNTLSKSDVLDVEKIIVSPNRLNGLVYKMLRVISFRTNQLSFLMSALDSKKANQLIKDSDCEWIFAPACSNLIYAGRKALKNKKLIYMSDATYHKMLGYYYNHSEHDQRVGNAWEQTAHNLATSIIIPAKWSYQDAIDYYKTPKEKLNIIKFGANMSDCGYKLTEAGKECYKLLLVGVDYVRKGVDLAIETVKLLNESSAIKYELSIVGLAKPKNLDLPNYVSFYGKLRKDDKEELKKLIECYSSHDIFILPTKAECAGIVFTEASMFGLPVFTYDTGGITDYVEDGITGKCLDAGCGAKDFCNVIKDSIENGSIEQYSLNARKKYEKELNWDFWLKQFEKIIKR
ncbi:glycosyltransferase family 4 protein [Butyrivibrio sp. YAB3001]|uniref:glycosyltransferase family 4 protein n=1 Tax=Butyrivibrio sp. YAB3001 TaxID=1520812 RepID=UPI0008F61BEB|nr:glycosyltransferase family 4 protein [Butyrivibrio sp. YAB3001]SFC62077.1 Glycosyltransferase involved in cell wall bisynthesis [Butyrivibrio sp. YAB3001]